MKLLYQADTTGESLESLREGFGECRDAPGRVREFALKLATGARERAEEIDTKIREAVKNWGFDRLAVIDLQLLRIGVYELFYCDDISANIVIDEAIEISREYSTAESSRFVNGVLGALCSKYVPHKVAPKGRKRNHTGP